MKSLAPSGVDFIKYGVSISIKSAWDKKFLTIIDTRCLRIKFSFTLFRLKSKYLYFIRSSSPPSVSFSIVKGGVSEWFKMLNSETNISIPPEGIFRFLDSLSITKPLTWITSSLPIPVDFLKTAFGVLVSSNTNWVIP